jgi:hypothetical protein
VEPDGRAGRRTRQRWCRMVLRRGREGSRCWRWSARGRMSRRSLRSTRPTGIGRSDSPTCWSVIVTKPRTWWLRRSRRCTSAGVAAMSAMSVRTCGVPSRTRPGRGCVAATWSEPLPRGGLGPPWGEAARGRVGGAQRVVVSAGSALAGAADRVGAALLRGPSEAETAEVVGCSVGTVKSRAARGIARLDELVGPTARARRGTSVPVEEVAGRSTSSTPTASRDQDGRSGGRER